MDVDINTFKRISIKPIFLLWLILDWKRILNTKTFSFFEIEYNMCKNAYSKNIIGEIDSTCGVMLIITSIIS